MDLDRPHHRTTTTTTTTTTTSELFICFTSRLSSSSSSMKLTKSILSPARARDQPVSLPTSLSRRLRTNGSIKGGGQASPMFPTNGKKRGSVLDNPEPSSPKVTCIGQVRVKTKKKVKQSQRSLSSKRSNDVSFRRLEQAPSDPLNQNEDKISIQNQRFSHSNSTVHYQSQECVSHRNQRWVHLPLTICEALRGFGSEFSCLFPCRSSSSSCFSTTENKEREERIDGSKDVNNGQRSCGAVFARWLVALQDGEAGKGREIELVVASTAAGEDDEGIETKQSTMRSSRRHVFEDLEFNDIETVEMEGGREEEKARVSICVPPKNALLLMRCRSDPMKMADLTNRFWESPAPKEEVVVDAQNCETNNGVEVIDEGCEVPEEEDLVGNEENPEAEAAMEMEVLESIELEKDEEKLENDELAQETEQQESGAKPLVPEVNSPEQFSEATTDEAPQDIEEDNTVLEPKEEEEEENVSISKTEDEAEVLAIEAELEEEEDRFKSTISKEIQETLLLADIAQNQTMTLQESVEKLDPDSETAEPEKIQNQEVVKNQFEYTKDPPPPLPKKESVLPECLLLMMCEPKLSMEVSKETWVCSTDFIRWLPERKQVLIKPPPPPPQPKKQVIVPEDKEQPKRRRSIDSKPPLKAHVNNRSQHLLQPPRSSCSFPATGGGGGGAPAMSMATMIEQKLVNAVAYEPFVLTRCKSEPMKTAAAKLAPDTCFWKNREIEPHRRSAFGVGAAGVGF